MRKRAILKNGTIAAVLGAALLLPSLGIGGSAATESGGFEVKSVNIAEPDISAVAGMDGLGAAEEVNAPKMCAAFGLEMTDELLDQSERNVEKLKAATAAAEQEATETGIPQGVPVGDMEVGAEGIVAFVDYSVLGGGVIRGAATVDTPDGDVFMVRAEEGAGGIFYAITYYCSNGGG